jgi:hypothetical protein
MNLLDAKIMAEKEIANHLYNKWKFRFSKGVNFVGKCNYSSKTISLSSPWTLVRDAKEVRDTILHEIAHALVGPYAEVHGNTWWLAAIKIGLKQPNRFANIEYIPESQRPPPKWVVVVKDENKVVHKYYRKPNPEMFENIKNANLAGRVDTRGKLQIVQYNKTIHTMTN